MKVINKLEAKLDAEIEEEQSTQASGETNGEIESGQGSSGEVVASATTDDIGTKPPERGVVKRKAGRPLGAKNKDTLFKELMTGSFQSKAIADIEKVYSVLFEKAHGGDMKAIKMVLDRVVPVSKAVDLADMEKGGIVVNVSVGSLEVAREDIEDAEFSETSH